MGGMNEKDRWNSKKKFIACRKMKVTKQTETHGETVESSGPINFLLNMGHG